MRMYNSCIEDIFPTNLQAGEIGVEIEVEGKNIPQDIASYWSTHKEGSLRGESAEYVLTKPCSRDNIYNFLKYLKTKLERNNAILELSNRTSVHVHLNMQGLSVRQIYSNICLYLILENLLVEYAGPSRVGNLFCLRATDAEFLIQVLVKAIQTENFTPFTNHDGLRYASCNVCSLSKFNTLEFRALRGTVDPDVIHEWIQILLAIKDASLKYPDPRMIFQDFSALGPEQFLRRILPNHYSKFKNVNTTWECVRNTQDIAYAVDWEVSLTPPKKRVFTGTAPIKARHPDAPRWVLQDEAFDHPIIQEGDDVMINAAPKPFNWVDVHAGLMKRRQP